MVKEAYLTSDALRLQDPTTFGRIVGNETNDEGFSTLLEEWLGVEVFPVHCPNRLHYLSKDSVVPFWFFGMFLSSVLEYVGPS